jgi:hypothetical protein
MTRAVMEVAVATQIAPRHIAELDAVEWATLLDVLEQRNK